MVNDTLSLAGFRVDDRTFSAAGPTGAFAYACASTAYFQLVLEP
jgi:hypothetical protein